MLIANELLASALLLEVDTHLASWFHARLDHSLASVFLAMSDPGSAGWVGALTILTAAGLAWKRAWNGLLMLFLAVPGGMLLNQIMKVSIARRRPFRESPFLDLGGYSFPSAHTMAATLIYGVLAILGVMAFERRRWRALAVLVATALVVMVGFSRVALGAHYLTDVIAGVLTGLLWLALCVAAIPQLRKAFVERVAPVARRDSEED